MEKMDQSAMKWLTRCASDTPQALALWQNEPAAPLTMPTGRYFDVVVVPERLGLEACDLIRRHCLSLGPVMLDAHAGKIGFIAPPRGLAAFTTVNHASEILLRGLHYLAEGDFVVVPGPAPLSNSRYQWLFAPTGRPDPSKLRTAMLAVTLCTASQNLARIDLPHVYTRLPSAPFCTPFARTDAAEIEAPGSADHQSGVTN